MAETEAVPAPAAAEEAAPAAAEDTKKKPTPGIRLHVKNLSETTTREELSELFKSYGEVLRAEVKKDDDGKCKGMGFVILSTMELAKQAQSEVNGKTLGEKELLVELVEPKAKEGKGKDKGKDRGKDGKGKDGKGKGKDKGKGKKGKKGGLSGEKMAARDGAMVEGTGKKQTFDDSEEDEAPPAKKAKKAANEEAAEPPAKKAKKAKPPVDSDDSE